MGVDEQTGSERVASDVAEGLAALKRELAAVVIFGALLVPVVSYLLDDGRGLAVLAAYGVGGAVWVRIRVRGLLLAARQRTATDQRVDDGA